MSHIRSSLIILTVLGLHIVSSRIHALDRPDIQSFDSNGVKISYFVHGKGEPVVLVHGWLSSAGINWALTGTSDLLARDFQVIAIDVRGHGLSDKPTKVDAYGMELVEDIARLLNHLNIKKAHIVGYSMGGIITAKFLVTHPDRVLSGTLAGSGWLKEGGFEQRIFAAGGRDGKPVGLCFQSLSKLALTENDIMSIQLPVAMIIGDKDGLKKLYVDPLHAIRGDWPVVEIPKGDHISCIMKPQFREEIAKWIKNPMRKE